MISLSNGFVYQLDQEKVNFKKFESLTFDENMFEVGWKILLDVANSPIISAKISFGAHSGEDKELDGIVETLVDGDDDVSASSSAESTICSVASKCEFRGNLLKGALGNRGALATPHRPDRRVSDLDMIETLLEEETRLDLQHWLQVAKEDAIRDARRRKSKLVGGFMSPSLAALRSFPPADVSPAHRTPSPSAQAEPDQEANFQPQDSPTSKRLCRRSPPESSPHDARAKIAQISEELDIVKRLVEANFLRATKLDAACQQEQTHWSEVEQRATEAEAEEAPSAEALQRDFLDRVREETIKLEESVKKLQEDDEKRREEEEVILDAKIDDLTQRLNRISVRPYSLLRSWRQLTLLLVFMALWPFVLRYFWTLYGRRMLKRLFKTLDWLYRLRDSTEPAIHTLIKRGRRVAKRDILGLKR